jgi:hypothetical protein
VIRKTGFQVEQDSFEQHVYENAQQKIIVLDEAPTQAIPLISEGDIAYFSGKVYFVIGGVLKEFSVSSTA